MSDYDSTNLVSSDEEGWTLELDEGLVENYDQGAEAVENDNFDFDDLDDEGIDAPYDLDLMDDVSEEEDPAFNEMIEKNRLELEQRKQAALKIQALQRGKKGRNAANHAKERKLLQEQGAAVVKIQARLRGRNERETQRKLKVAAVCRCGVITPGSEGLKALMLVPARSKTWLRRLKRTLSCR